MERCTGLARVVCHWLLSSRASRSCSSVDSAAGRFSLCLFPRTRPKIAVRVRHTVSPRGSRRCTRFSTASKPRRALARASQGGSCALSLPRLASLSSAFPTCLLLSFPPSLHRPIHRESCASPWPSQADDFVATLLRRCPGPAPASRSYSSSLNVSTVLTSPFAHLQMSGADPTEASFVGLAADVKANSDLHTEKDKDGYIFEETRAGSLSTQEQEVYPDTPTEEDLRTLRRVPGRINIASFLIAYVELAERFSYYGCVQVVRCCVRIVPRRSLLTSMAFSARLPLRFPCRLLSFAPSPCTAWSTAILCMFRRSFDGPSSPTSSSNRSRLAPRRARLSTTKTRPVLWAWGSRRALGSRPSTSSGCTQCLVRLPRTIQEVWRGRWGGRS